MKRLLLLLGMAISLGSNAQVSITQNEMPHAGDNLFRTRAVVNPFMNYAATGANYVWNFNLVADTQDSTQYQTVASTNFVYALTYVDIFINPNRANVAKPGVDIAFNNLLPVTNPYSFYYRSASIYKAVGFGMELAGIPVPVIFTDQDEIYNLPINYGDADTSHSAYNLSLPTLAYYGYEQNRMNEVDGWGVINTPAGSFDALRVKTTLLGKDTISIDTLNLGFAIDRPVITEYKWLSPGLRVPVLQVNTTELFGVEIITDIFFYDLPRTISVVQPLSTIICPGSSVTVPYDITGTFNQGGIFVPANIFRAQLSDMTGDFTNAVVIGSVTTNISGTITCTIPANTPPGTGYRIRVVSTNPAFTGTDNGFDITVGTAPVGVASAGGNTQFCAGDSVLLSAVTDPAYTYQWQLDNIDIGGAINPDYSATLNGSYTVIVTNVCGSSTSSAIDVVVNPLPEHTFSQPTYLSCNGALVTLATQNISGQDSLSYQWYLDGNLIAGEVNDSLAATAGGNYTFEVTNTITGCIYNVSTNVVIDSIMAPAITSGGNLSFCDGGSVSLNASGDPGTTYQWQLDGIDIPGATTDQVTASTGGIYTVIATSVAGCTAVSPDSIAVIVNPLPGAPVITASGNTVFCSGDSVLLSVIAVVGFDYQWTLNGSNLPGAIFNQFNVTDSSGSYSIFVTDMAGCSAEAVAMNVTINPLPAMPVITQSNDTLFATGTGPFQWYLDGTLITGATDPFIVPAVNGNYTVMVTDVNGCGNTSVDFPMTNVGLVENNASGFRVYPNPSSGLFSIVLNDRHMVDGIITIEDVSGRKILNMNVDNLNMMINISSLANGIYILKLEKSMQPLIIQKIIKQ